MRRLVPVVLVLVVALAVAVLAGSSDERRSGPTGDPRSTTDAGTRAAVLLLESEGREVRTGNANRSADVMVLFHNEVNSWAVDDYEDWLAFGGQLVVFGSDAEIAAPRAGTARIDTESRCGRDGYTEITAPSVGVGPGVSGSELSSCFAVGDGWFFTVSEFGEGLVVSVASPRPFLNRSLADGDHAGLLLALLGETSGAVLFVDTGVGVGSGDKSLSDLVAESVWALLFTLAFAWLVFMVQRGRRLGVPVAEGNVVQIDGFEMVKATARLYDRTKARQLGVDRMRVDLVDQLNRRWSGRTGTLPSSGTSVDQARRFATLLHLDEDAAATLELALTGSVGDDASFVAVTSALVRARAIGSGAAKPAQAKTESP